MVTTTIIGIVSVLALIYYYVKRTYSYWERKSVPFVQPVIPWGNFKSVGKLHLGEMIQGFYNDMKGKGKFFGIYAFQSPVIVPTDLDFIKNILIKDFAHFQDRGMYYNEKDDPLSAHLFSIEGQKWRQLRTKLTPTFTSGKMKFMYPTVINVANKFKGKIDELLGKDHKADVEIRELLARFTTDVIGECAFGIECNSLQNPNAEFRKMGKKIFIVDKLPRLKFMFATAFPSFSRSIGITTTLPDVGRFFIGIVKETVAFREKNDTKRNDFMDLLIKMKNLSGTDGITLDEISAQAFVFFLAGFETSSTVMTYALYELMLNKKMQSRAREEIMAVMAKHNNEFTYECMLDMGYIEQILQESLRKYPPVTNLNRVVTKDYKIPDSDIVLEKGTAVFIPVFALHRDPEYYPNPEVFEPDRFNADEVQNRNNSTYLPFGDGPRNCIGLRFGMMQARVGLVTLLSNYEFSICDQSTIPLNIAKNTFILTAEGGVYLNIKKVS